MLRTTAILLALLPSPVVQQGGGGADPSPDAIRMGSPRSMSQTASRESLWPAPTAEDWKLPCLVPWQRTFDDAVRVAKATGKPILVCVNMDGEIASEHYAGVRYRQPDIARKLCILRCRERERHQEDHSTHPERSAKRNPPP